MMKNKIKEMIVSLSEIFEGTPWYGDSVMQKLENVPYIIGDKSCIPQSHNVAQIMGHLIAWKTYALQKLKGNTDFDIEVGSKRDWPNIEVNSQKDWEELKHKLVVSQHNIYEFLKEKQDDFLNQKVSGRDYNFGYLLTGIIQHDIYHIGQIGLIQSQLKNNEKQSGVFKA